MLSLGLSLTSVALWGRQPVPKAARWRMLTDNSLEADYVHMSEVEMRDTIGGADQCSGGTATASSMYSASYPPEKAFDNVTMDGVFWHSAAEPTSWLEYAFPSPITVKEISIQVRQDNAGAPGPRIVDVQYYNGTSWVTWWSFTTGPWSINEVRTFAKP